MQKKLIALAVAGLVSGGALAQASNVTMYGVLDANVNWMDTGFGRKMQVGTGGLNASRLGFKGSEDIGGGTKAVFTLEAGFSMDTQSMGTSAPALGINNSSFFSTAAANGTGGQFFSRQGFVGLESGWGTVHFGRLYTGTYIGTAVLADPAVGGLYGSTGNAQSIGMGTRVNNAVTYKTPNMNGFYGWFTYSAGSENNVTGNVPTAAGATTSTNDKAGRGYDLAFFYSNGPFNGVATVWHFNGASWAAGETDLGVRKGWLLSGNYDMKVVKLFFALVGGKIEGGNYENVTKAFNKTSTTSFGAIVPVSAAGRFAFNRVGFNDKAVTNKDFNVWGLSYLHDLSKRTTLYTSYGKLTNNENSSVTLLTGGDMGGTVKTAGFDPSGFMMGMRHTF